MTTEVVLGRSSVLDIFMYVADNIISSIHMKQQL